MFSPQKAVLIDSLIHSPLLSSTLVIAASSLAAEYILEYTEILRNKDEQSLTPDVGKSLISISTEPHENIQMARDDAHRFNHSIDVMSSEFFCEVLIPQVAAYELCLPYSERKPRRLLQLIRLTSQEHQNTAPTSKNIWAHRL